MLRNSFIFYNWKFKLSASLSIFDDHCNGHQNNIFNFAVLNVLFTKNFLKESGDFGEIERHAQIILRSIRLIYD